MLRRDQNLPYGLSDLPLEPPDDPNFLFSPNQFASIGMPRAGGPQIIPARFGRRIGQTPPIPFPQQGGRPPGWPSSPTRIPALPGFWNRSSGVLHQILPRIGNGPGVGSGDDVDCDEEWRQARADCAKELAKPFPNKTFTGGYTNVEDCARGLVPERCAGNPVDWGSQRNRK